MHNTSIIPLHASRFKQSKGVLEYSCVQKYSRQKGMRQNHCRSWCCCASRHASTMFAISLLPGVCFKTLHAYLGSFMPWRHPALVSLHTCKQSTLHVKSGATSKNCLCTANESCMALTHSACHRLVLLCTRAAIMSHIESAHANVNMRCQLPYQVSRHTTYYVHNIHIHTHMYPYMYIYTCICTYITN